MKKSNRRDFLKGSGTFLTGTMLSNLIFQSILDKALAQATGTEPINYAMINQYGAPPRWYFDLPLNAGLGGAIHNPDRNFGNAFKKVGNDYHPDYVSAPFKNKANKTFHLPTLWSQKVPNGAGTMRPLSSILPHALFVRGMNNLINGHEINNQMLVAPQLTEKTLLGLNSDKSSRPLATILHGYATAFANKGEKNGNSPILLTAIGGDAQISTLLAPFTDGATIFNRSLSAGTEAKVNQALQAFRIYAEDTLKVKQSDLSTMQATARAAMKDFMARSGELSDRWKATLARYKGIVAKALHPVQGEMPGLNDVAIPLKGRQIDHYGGTYLVTKDLREIADADTTVTYLAEGFALIEFLFIEKLSTTISFSPVQALTSAFLSDLRYSPTLVLKPQLDAIKKDIAKAAFDNWEANKLTYDELMSQVQAQINAQTDATKKAALLVKFAAFNSGKPKTGTKSNLNAPITYDQHNLGAMLSIYCTTLYYRALGACLAEAIDKLKAAGIFNKTLIHVAGDFNRNPLKNGSGSDHGWEGSVQSFFTGMYDVGPTVIGNITKKGSELDPTHPGCWGYAAPILIRAASGTAPKVERPIQPGDVANSVANLLGVSAVSTNGYTVFGRDPNTGKLVVYVAECTEK